MLRLLSIRNFVVVETLDLELDAGFTVLTGETGAGKSILLDALALLLGDRFELRQLRPGAERAELAAAFDVDDRPGIVEWLVAHDLAAALVGEVAGDFVCQAVDAGADVDREPGREFFVDEVDRARALEVREALA